MTTPEQFEEAVETQAIVQGEMNVVPPPAPDDIRVMEAILFATAEPITTNAIRERMPEGADVGGLLLALQEEYKTRGVHLTEKDGTWAFRTAHDLADVMRVKREVQRKLSRSAMETLAIIAYHQPVTRAEVENIRGVVTNKGTLDILMEIGWVRPGRRRETPGRPLTWVTTAAFMDHFGLESLMDLPGLDELKASGLLDRRPAIETIGGTGDLFGDNDSEDLKQAAADLAAEDGDIEDETGFVPAEAAYDDDVSDDEWESAKADESPIALAGEDDEDSDEDDFDEDEPEDEESDDEDSDDEDSDDEDSDDEDEYDDDEYDDDEESDDDEDDDESDEDDEEDED